ncbi:hypothetical protein evm_003839 [Chilo suppressalis]|nr:hypothetical protein evm_003839 [Chilo suppressalis]
MATANEFEFLDEEVRELLENYKHKKATVYEPCTLKNVKECLIGINEELGIYNINYLFNPYIDYDNSTLTPEALVKLINATWTLLHYHKNLKEKVDGLSEQNHILDQKNKQVNGMLGRLKDKLLSEKNEARACVASAQRVSDQSEDLLHTLSETKAKLFRVTKQKDALEKSLRNEVSRLKLDNEKLLDRLRNKSKRQKNLALPDKADISRDWVCPNCKKNVRKGDNSQTSVKGMCDALPTSAVSTPEGSSGINNTEADSGHGELAIFMSEMREFRKEMNILRESLSVRLDNFEQRLCLVEQRQAEISTSNTSELERTIADLKQELNERDQEALLTDLEIGELPEERGVSVQTVTDLAARLGVALEPRDVVFAERVGAPPAEAGGRPRRVVVRLARRHLRDDLLKAARVRRKVVAPAPAPVDGGGAPTLHRVYINERLTRHNRQIFHLVRGQCKKLQWSTRGRTEVECTSVKRMEHPLTKSGPKRILNVCWDLLRSDSK